MPDGYKLDPATLEQVTSSLRKARTTLDSIGKPTQPDGGKVTAGMSGAIAKLLADAGALVTGLAAAGEQADQARTAYLKREDATRDDLRPR